LAIKEKKIPKMLKVSLKSLEKIILELEKYSKLNTPARGEARQGRQYSIPSPQKAVAR